MARKKAAPAEVRLAFTDPDAPGDEGAIILSADRRTVRLDLPAGLRSGLVVAAQSGDEAVLKWGISVLAGFALAGAVLHYKEKRRAGYIAFGLAGLAGIGGWYSRRNLRTLAQEIESDQPVARVHVAAHGDDGLAVRLDCGGLRKFTVTLGPGEFDPAQADMFLRAFAEAQAVEEQ